MRQEGVIAGRFEIEARAGGDPRVAVCRARDRASGEVVLLKMPGGGEASDIARAIMREGEALALLAELHHPGVVRYVAHGTTASGGVYVTTEWIEGEDLWSRLSRARLTVDETVMLAARAASALAAVHACGIVHRDLKPGNLFLVDQDIRQVKLLDFGIAQLRSENQMTKTDMIVGTLHYMAPEQARGERIDARADVFALGCVLFECLTGKLPFTGEHFMAFLKKILFEDAPRVRDLRPEVPAELDALVARMLAKNPEERPRDGAAVAEALAATGLVKT